jgi:exodeoxyribonuclease VII small subunit
MTSNEPPNNNDDGFQQLSFFAAPTNTEAEAIEVKAVEPVQESVQAEEGPKKTRSKSKVAKPATTTEQEKGTDSTVLSAVKEELLVLPAVATSIPSSKANDSRRTVIMNVTEPELKIDFEASLAELETVVKELDGEVKLEKALQLFEQGIKLSVECEQFIKGAEAKIEILKKQADGSLATEVFQGERVDLDD